MSATRRILLYSALRLVLFVVPFVAFLLLELYWWLAMLLAAIVATCLSYLFLRPQRDAVAETVYSWRNGTGRDADSDLENAVLDRHEDGENQAGSS